MDPMCKNCGAYKSCYGTPTEDHSGKDMKPEPKPLAQYLALYLEAEIPAKLSAWRELLEQALDAYESTENVKIKIQKK